jgi:cytochrome c oxidase assembly protein subunit 15
MVPATLLTGLVAVQVTLGALTVLSQRDVWINSFHVVCGALVLTTSLVLTLRSWRVMFSEGAGEGARTPEGPSLAAGSSRALDPRPTRLQA